MGGGGGGGVASDNDGLGALTDEEARQCHRAGFDVGGRFVAVGNMAGIGHVDQVGIGQSCANMTQHGKTAYTRIENADGSG